MNNGPAIDRRVVLILNARHILIEVIVKHDLQRVVWYVSRLQAGATICHTFANAIKPDAIPIGVENTESLQAARVQIFSFVFGVLDQTSDREVIRGVADFVVGILCATLPGAVREAKSFIRIANGDRRKWDVGLSYSFDVGNHMVVVEVEYRVAYVVEAVGQRA